MSRQLKRWESPRREGRNHKGRGGSARQRQKRKQLQALRQQLQSKNQSKKQSGKDPSPSRFVFWTGTLVVSTAKSFTGA